MQDIHSATPFFYFYWYFDCAYSNFIIIMTLLKDGFDMIREHYKAYKS